jgi:hypothetical protein
MHSSGDSRRENADAHPPRCLTTKSELPRVSRGNHARDRGIHIGRIVRCSATVRLLLT